MVEFRTKGKGKDRIVYPLKESLKNPRVMESQKFQENTRDALEAAAREELKQLAEMDNIDAMLTNMKQFAGFLGEFSAYNAMLIRMQDPDATRVMSKDNWERLGYTLRKNASPIAILVPYGVPKRYSKAEIAEKIEKMKEEGHSEEYILSKLQDMLKEKRATTHVFGVGKVYDAKSVNGKEPPEERYKNSVLYEAMKRGAQSQFKVEEETLTDNSRGETEISEDGNVNRIVVMKVPNESKEPLNTLAHEMAHAILKHSYGKMPRWKAEVEAELAAFLVLEHYGVNFQKEAGAYIKSWLGNNKLDEESIDRAANAARQIIQLTDQNLLKSSI